MKLGYGTQQLIVKIWTLDDLLRPGRYEKRFCKWLFKDHSSNLSFVLQMETASKFVDAQRRVKYNARGNCAFLLARWFHLTGKGAHKQLGDISMRTGYRNAMGASSCAQTTLFSVAMYRQMCFSTARSWFGGPRERQSRGSEEGRRLKCIAQSTNLQPSIDQLVIIWYEWNQKYVLHAIALMPARGCEIICCLGYSWLRNRNRSVRAIEQNSVCDCEFACVCDSTGIFSSFEDEFES